MIAKGGVFAASILGRETPPSFVGRFGFSYGRDTDKFQGMEPATDGLPWLLTMLWPGWRRKWPGAMTREPIRFLWVRWWTPILCREENP